MQSAKICQAQGKVSVGPELALEHDAVSRTVHRLHAKLLMLAVEQEHVILHPSGIRQRLPSDWGITDLVVGVVPRRLPQVHIEDVRRDNLVEPTLSVLPLIDRSAAVHKQVMFSRTRIKF